MRKTIAIWLLASIIVTGVTVAFFTGLYAKRSLEDTVDASLVELQGSLQTVFQTFDTLVAIEEGAIHAKMVADLPRMYQELLDQGYVLENMPRKELGRVMRKYGYSDGYILNRDGVIVTTTFKADQGFNLNTISEGFSKWLNAIYNKGEVVTDRLILSTKTGILNIYGYYGPVGTDGIFEASMNIRRYVADKHGEDYVVFLFRKLFENAMQSAVKVVDADLYMYNDLVAWSVLHEGVALDDDIRHRLEKEQEIRIQDDDLLTVYSRFHPALKSKAFQQGFSTMIVYDVSQINQVVWNFVLYTLVSMIVVIPIVYMLVTYVIGRRIITPMGEVMTALDRIRLGDYETNVKVKSVPEIETIASTVNLMQDEILARENALAHARDVLETRVEERTFELNEARCKAEALARTDMLTGLPNRRCFFEDGDRMVKQAKRFDHDVSMVMMDIDHFKTVNDTYGHALGDAVLVSVAEVMRNTVREVDLLGRLGGEEFSVLLPETSESEAVRFAERIRARIAEASVMNGDEVVTVTCSCGIVNNRNGETHSLEAMLARADEALYVAKEAGRNRVEVFVPR